MSSLCIAANGTWLLRLIECCLVNVYTMPVMMKKGSENKFSVSLCLVFRLDLWHFFNYVFFSLHFPPYIVRPAKCSSVMTLSRL